VSFSHHESHAAAGYYTAPFDDCNILVIDAIGEWDTITIWDNMKKIKSWKYPYSLGLLYSAITQRIGYQPNEHEYITMGMAAFGNPIYNLERLLSQNNHMGVGYIYPRAKRINLAAPIELPASPGEGIIQMFLSFILLFATQFNAHPPMRTRFFLGHISTSSRNFFSYNA
jgi:carbamoyltransferase